MAITVTDGRGATLAGVQVEIVGTTDRSGETNASGQINFPGLQAGTYRLRFSGDSVIAFEREVVLRAGQVADVDVMLNAAPKKEPPPPAPAPTPPPAITSAVGPTGQPQAQNVVDLLDKEFIRREPRRETLLSCSGSTRTTMVQLNEPLPERLYASADAVYYVLAGEGAVKINGQENRVTTNGVLSIPRGASHSFARRGNRPLVLLAILSGEPCDTAK
jgi:mannose-6-phosphate isomerase-like protein (cupin superfamily)